MKKVNYLIIIGLTSLLSANTLCAQEVLKAPKASTLSPQDEELLKGFDEAAIITELKKKPNIPESEYSAIIRHKKMDYYNEQKEKGHHHEDLTPYFSVQKTPVGPCDNAGFEDGTFTNWLGATGLCDLMPTTPTTWTPGFVATRHTIVSGAGFDPIAINPTTLLPEIPLIAPGGLSYSTRLGNDQIGAETEYLRYPIAVTAANTSFTYQYAVVLEWVSLHTAVQQPRFDIVVFDAAGNPVSGPCGAYSIEAIAASSDSTFTPFNVVGGVPQGYYKKWTTVSIDLTSYIGSTVTIQFQTSDCTQTGHFGYAYIDCSCSQLQASVAFCPNDTLLLLSAPPGFNTYQWYDATSTQILGATNDTLMIANPVLGQVYSVSMQSASGCGTSLTVTLAYSDILVNTNVVPVSCFGDNDGYAYATPSGAIPPFTYSWVDASTGGVISTNDSLLNAVAGTYYVTVSSLGGCSRIDTLSVTQPPLPSDTTGVGTTFCPGDPSITLLAPPGYVSYEWYLGTGGNPPILGTDDSLFLANPVAGTIFTVVMQPPVILPATYACPVFLTTTLNYSPPPLLPDYIVKSNVFTPDGDSKNETFDLNQFAYVKEFHFEVYNRWGKKVFESDNLANQWDGKIKGREAEEGVYFWLASYVPSCEVDAKPIENKGFVHLLRGK